MNRCRPSGCACPDGYSGSECQTPNRCGGSIDCGEHGACVVQPLESEGCMEDTQELWLSSANRTVTLTASSELSDAQAADDAVSTASGWSAATNDVDQYLQVRA